MLYIFFLTIVLFYYDLCKYFGFLSLFFYYVFKFSSPHLFSCFLKINFYFKSNVYNVFILFKSMSFYVLIGAITGFILTKIKIYDCMQMKPLNHWVRRWSWLCCIKKPTVVYTGYCLPLMVCQPSKYIYLNIGELAFLKNKSSQFVHYELGLWISCSLFTS